MPMPYGQRYCSRVALTPPDSQTSTPQKNGESLALPARRALRAANFKSRLLKATWALIVRQSPILPCLYVLEQMATRAWRLSAHRIVPPTDLWNFKTKRTIFKGKLLTLTDG